jgi:hypothetical protein
MAKGSLSLVTIKGMKFNELKAEPKSEKQVRENFADWHKRNKKPGQPGLTWIEFALGGSPGVPDVLVPHEGILVPVELKVGQFRASDGAMLVKFRPAQINWHIEMARGGIQTFAIIATRVGNFYVRGKDIVQFAEGICEHWPEYAFHVAGDFHGFFHMIKDYEQHHESIENYRRNSARIEAAMASSLKKNAPPIDLHSKSAAKSQPRKTRAGAAPTNTPAVAKASAKHPKQVLHPISVHIAGAKGISKAVAKAKKNWPKPTDIATPKPAAQKKRAKQKAVVAGSQKAKERSTADHRKASRV